MNDNIIKIKFHSIVDVITNSSTVIFTYQNSIKEAKELVGEVMKLMGSDETPDDAFYYGVFCDDIQYLEGLTERDCEVPDDFPNENFKYGTDEYKAQNKAQQEWLNDIKMSIIKGEVKQPEWMTKIEDNENDYGEGWSPDSYLTLIPKDYKYAELGVKIKKLLGSVGADGGRDG